LLITDFLDIVNIF